MSETKFQPFGQKQIYLLLFIPLVHLFIGIIITWLQTRNLLRCTHFRHSHIMIQTNLYLCLQVFGQFGIVLAQQHLAGKAALATDGELELQIVTDPVAPLGPYLPTRGSSFISAI